VLQTPRFTLSDYKAVLQTSQLQNTASKAGYANLYEENLIGNNVRVRSQLPIIKHHAMIFTLFT